MRKLRGILINHSQNHKNLEIFGIEFHKIQYYSYFEENLSTQCTNLGKFGHCNEQNKGNLVIVMNKFTAKYGGYWRKFGGYLADIRERI